MNRIPHAFNRTECPYSITRRDAHDVRRPTVLASRLCSVVITQEGQVTQRCVKLRYLSGNFWTYLE
jgi:hypothetical protein